MQYQGYLIFATGCTASKSLHLLLAVHRYCSSSTMIWKKLFPSEGGGALRRWIRVKKAIFEKSRDSEHILKGPITLFDFAHRDDAADVANLHTGTTKGGWRISDDEVIGGFSRGKVAVIASMDDFQRYKRGEEPLSFYEKDPSVESSVNDDFTPFIRWNGTIDTTIGDTSKVVSVNTAPYLDEYCALSATLFVGSHISTVVHIPYKSKDPGFAPFARLNFHLAAQI
jgi:hypothetical protein